MSEVCGHGGFKEKCEICELKQQLIRAKELLKGALDCKNNDCKCREGHGVCCQCREVITKFLERTKEIK